MKLRESPIISTMDWYLFTSTSIASIHCICKRNGIRTTEQRQHHWFLHCANCIRIKSMPNQCCWMGNIDSANHCIGKSWVDFCCSVSVNRWIQLFFFPCVLWIYSFPIWRWYWCGFVFFDIYSSHVWSKAEVRASVIHRLGLHINFVIICRNNSSHRTTHNTLHIIYKHFIGSFNVWNLIANIGWVLPLIPPLL